MWQQACPPTIPPASHNQGCTYLISTTMHPNQGCTPHINQGCPFQHLLPTPSIPYLLLTNHPSMLSTILPPANTSSTDISSNHPTVKSGRMGVPKNSRVCVKDDQKTIQQEPIQSPGYIRMNFLVTNDQPTSAFVPTTAHKKLTPTAFDAPWGATSSTTPAPKQLQQPPSLLSNSC